METTPPFNRYVIYVLFLLSGACSLIYELLWFKDLSLIFGATIPATSIVAATFMGGLALGSYFFGRIADRSRNLLRTYAFLELAVALCAALFPAGLSLTEKAYVALALAIPGSPEAVALFRFLFAALLLLPPTICMGGTYPVLCRHFTGPRLGGVVGRLYAINTLGAMAGTFSAGFALIPALGLSRTLLVALFLNGVIAVTALLLSIRSPQAAGLPAPRPPEEGSPLSPLHPHRPFVLLAAGLTGFFSLTYEILWTRVFLLFLGNTTYAFATILSVFLLGLALGGAAFSRIFRQVASLAKSFGILTGLMGLSVALTLPFYDQLARPFQWVFARGGEHWWVDSLLCLLIVLVVIGLPTVLSGILLPMAITLLRPDRSHTGEGIGLVVFCNTVGAIVGSLGAAFVLLPLHGLHGALLLTALLNTLLGIGVLFVFRRSFPSRGLGGICLALAGLAALPLWAPEWNPKLFNAGVYYYAPAYRALGGLDSALADVNILAVFEGKDTTVAVKERSSDGTRALSINGKIDAGNSRDMITQVLLAQAPLLVHPAPRTALVIGLGSGITAGAATASGLTSIDCVEISQGVVDASHFFAKENLNALADHRVHLFLRDGRNFLLTREQRYDVIISEPSNPWQTGNANLFTADFYRLAARRLNEEGIFCQWLPLYDLPTENIRVICNTFLQAFSNCLAFDVGNGDILLLGSNRRMGFAYQTMRSALSTPATARVLEPFGILTAGDFIARHYLFSELSLRRFAEGAPINSDEFPTIEYSRNIRKELKSPFVFTTLGSMEQSRLKEPLPLYDIGNSNTERAAALADLGKSMFREGKKDIAGDLFDLAKKYQGQQ